MFNVKINLISTYMLTMLKQMLISDISDGVAELISITRKQKKVNDAMDVTVERVTVTPPPMLDHLAVRSSMNGLQ